MSEKFRVPAEGELLFLPLGGTGEIGMNVNLYGCNGKWIMVDLGICFAEDNMPGIDILVPDLSFIEEQKHNLEALFITHAHEDHLGAIPYLWEQLGVPIYAPRFSASLLCRKLNEVDLLEEVPVHVVDSGDRIKVADFEVEYIHMTHSTPQAHSLAIRTPAGTVVHSGDWKLDDNPVVGELSQTDRLKAVGDEGVLALISDSTNVFNQTHTGSEGPLYDEFVKLFKKYDGRAIAVTTFASNVARVDSIARAAETAGRSVVLVGRSLWRYVDTAKEVGYLDHLPPFVHEREASDIPRSKVLYLCTGCQGEHRAAMARIAYENHPHIQLQSDDVVIFSSRIIPGNERSIQRLQNKLAYDGIEVVTPKDANIHVSGHPSAVEMSKMYEWVRPTYSVPVHGEGMHLVEHADLALKLGVEESFILDDGQMLRLAPEVDILEAVQAGRFAIDSGIMIPDDSEVIQARKRMMFNGFGTLFLVADKNGGLLTEPRLSLQGVPEEEENMMRFMCMENLEHMFKRLSKKELRDDEVLAEEARRAVRGTIRKRTGKRPTIQVELVRL